LSLGEVKPITRPLPREADHRERGGVKKSPSFSHSGLFILVSSISIKSILPIKYMALTQIFFNIQNGLLF
jgi:hypothetical protein